MGSTPRTRPREGLLEYPAQLRSWPAVGGLAVLALAELLLPVTSDPRTLVLVILAYLGWAVTGAAVFSSRVWFRRGDPLSVLFRLYGAVAPLQRTDEGVDFRLPGSRLGDERLVSDASLAAFVILLVWELTFNGFVVTPPGASAVEALVGIGLPPAAVYVGLFVVGYGVFFAAFAAAARLARRTAPTYRSTGALVRRFASPLLAIAAGYHLAHYLAFSLSMSPTAVAVLANPLSPPVNPTVLSVPAWFGTLDLAFVVAGHVLAIWAAHAISLETFPGRLQAIRSQYPFILVMIGYTMVSLWLLTLPTSPPPYVAGTQRDAPRASRRTISH